MVYIVTLLEALLGLVFRGENLKSGLGWLDPVTVVLERHSLPGAVTSNKESHRMCGVMRLWVWIQ